MLEDETEETSTSGEVSEETPEVATPETESEKDPRIKALSDEAAKHRREKQAIKAEHEAALKKLKALEDKDKSELERATARAAELEAELTKFKEQAIKSSLESAFLSASKVTWNSNKAALTLARSEGLLDDAVSSDGEVDQAVLKKALETLAKEHPYLVATAKTEDTPPSGDHGGSGKSSGSNVDREKLYKKFPALRR